VAALIRADNTNRNSGARDQLIVGKTTSALRAVLSFGLTTVPTGAVVTGVSLDYWTVGTNSLGTVGAMELHALNGTPVEGTGDGNGSGAGSGVTWVSRDGQTGAGHSWTNAGGDFNPTVLSSVAGYVGNLPDTQKTFSSSADFVAVAQSAVTQGQPLNLMIYSPATEAGANNVYSRINSDDCTNMAERPQLTLTYVGSPAPAGMTATAISWSEVALTWKENITNETGFVIERMTDTNGAWTTVITTGPNVTNANNWGLASASVYSFRVKAVFADGSNSSYATSSAVTTLAATGRPPIVVMPLGDSITQGASQPSAVPGGYRSPLFSMLTNAGYQIRFVGSASDNSSTTLSAATNATHEGHGGYTTTDMLNNLDANGGTGGNNGGHWLDGITGTRSAVYPDVILLMAGVNDLGVNQLSATQGLAGLDAVLNKLVAMRPAVRIIVSTLTPYIGTNYPNREAHQVEFNTALPALVASHQAAGHHIQMCDVRTQVSITNAAAMLCSDGVHPIQAGYNAIASVWFEAFKTIPMIENWRLNHFGSPSAGGSNADAADRDGDGASNLEEYALGTNPTNAVPEHPLRPGIVTDLGANYFGLSFPRRKDTDLGFYVELSSGLGGSASWTNVAVQTVPSAGSATNFEQVTVRDSQPVDAAPSRFMRLRVMRP
jgi:lysophospholipase L1-like esterase